VVRKHMGYTRIAAPHAQEIEAFYERHLNPYLNFHRPCGVPEEVTNAKGKVKRVYRWCATPGEILRRNASGPCRCRDNRLARQNPL
jgi:hypothetical protein